MSQSERWNGLIVRIISMLFLLATGHASPATMPFSSSLPAPRLLQRWQHETGSEVFRKQMENPSDVFSVMLLIGGDIVQKAVAQMCGRRVTFVAFSFGWVTYAFSTLMSASGDGSLLPDPEFDVNVITISSRNRRSNHNWALSRLVRDLEHDVEQEGEQWYEIRPDSKSNDQDHLRTNDAQRTCILSGANDSSLLVTFCTAKSGWAQPSLDAGIYVYFLVVPIQLAIAVIPVVLYGDWSVVFITAFGTILALVTASLREWRLEKYQARSDPSATYAITRGNGYPHVFIIDRPGLYLDDLASAVRKADRRTRIESALLALLWIFFLITAGGLRQHTWPLLGIGLIGMVQNVWVAGRHRHSSAHGLPVKIGETIGRKVKGQAIAGLQTHTFSRQVYKDSRRPKVMDILKEVETIRNGVGQALLPEFFHETQLRDDEKIWWAAAEDHSKNKGIKSMPALPRLTIDPAIA